MFQFVILLAVLVSFTEATTVSSCAFPQPLPDAVRISGCSAQPCQFIKGDTVNVEVDFTAPSQVTSSTASINYTMFGLTLPFNLPPNKSNVCANLLNGATCPLNALQSATYTTSFDTTGYPTISTKFEVSLKNQNSAVLACFTVQVSLVNP